MVEILYDFVEIVEKLVCFASITDVDPFGNLIFVQYGVHNFQVKFDDDPYEC